MDVVVFKMAEDGQSNQCYGEIEFKIKTAKLDIYTYVFACTIHICDQCRTWRLENG